MWFRLIGQDVWEEHDVDGRRAYGPAVAEDLFGIAVDGRELWSAALRCEERYRFLFS